MIILLAALLSMDCHAQSDSLVVVFWNVENFFSYDTGYEPSRHWNRKRFEAKCNGIAKVLFKIADGCGRFPDAVGFAEVENCDVLKRLIGLTPLRKLDYGIIHFDSPDRRGIDCALLYRRSSLKLCEAVAGHLYDADGNVVATRDILLARFDSLSVLVNHHPSKLGDGAESLRGTAMARLRELCDSVGGRWLAVGDFNDDVWHNGGKGTIKYNGRWEKIDGCFSYGFSDCREEVFADPSLLVKDSSFGGMKPRRCYVGPRYQGGISDHLPIVVKVFF